MCQSHTFVFHKKDIAVADFVLDKTSILQINCINLTILNSIILM